MIINKVIVSYQNPDNMEQINKLTSLDFDHTDNWVDYSTFEIDDKTKEIFITKQEGR